MHIHIEALFCLEKVYKLLFYMTISIEWFLILVYKFYFTCESDFLVLEKMEW